MNAEIIQMSQLSAHAGKSELLRWLGGIGTAPKQTFLTHGEPVAARSLQQAIVEKFSWNVAVARYLDTITI